VLSTQSFCHLLSIPADLTWILRTALLPWNAGSLLIYEFCSTIFGLVPDSWQHQQHPMTWKILASPGDENSMPSHTVGMKAPPQATLVMSTALALQTVNAGG